MRYLLRIQQYPVNNTYNVGVQYYDQNCFSEGTQKVVLVLEEWDLKGCYQNLFKGINLQSPKSW